MTPAPIAPRAPLHCVSTCPTPGLYLPNPRRAYGRCNVAGPEQGQSDPDRSRIPLAIVTSAKESSTRLVDCSTPALSGSTSDNVYRHVSGSIRDNMNQRGYIEISWKVHPQTMTRQATHKICK